MRLTHAQLESLYNWLRHSKTLSEIQRLQLSKVQVGMMATRNLGFPVKRGALDTVDRYIGVPWPRSHSDSRSRRESLMTAEERIDYVRSLDPQSLAWVPQDLMSYRRTVHPQPQEPTVDKPLGAVLASINKELSSVKERLTQIEGVLTSPEET